jgi:hypothetical protein
VHRALDLGPEDFRTGPDRGREGKQKVTRY